MTKEELYCLKTKCAPAIFSVRISRPGTIPMSLAASLLVLMTSLLLFTACGSYTATEPAGDSSHKYSEIEEDSFSVGESSSLVVESFVGNITVRPGAGGSIQIKATKWAAREDDLRLVNVEMSKLSGLVKIKTDKPASIDNVSVDIEITAPSGTNIDIDLGVGSIDYVNRPGGGCFFNTGVGSIKLDLPADINVIVDLATGVGSINIDFNVEGEVSQKTVNGTIGDGDEGEIRARTGVGDIEMTVQ